MGNVNLDGEFKPTESREEEKVPMLAVATEQPPAEPETPLVE
jgi:hypothetical protein